MPQCRNVERAKAIIQDGKQLFLKECAKCGTEFYGSKDETRDSDIDCWCREVSCRQRIPEQSRPFHLQQLITAAYRKYPNGAASILAEPFPEVWRP
jgi:hypothetical protein